MCANVVVLVCMCDSVFVHLRACVPVCQCISVPAMAIMTAQHTTNTPPRKSTSIRHAHAHLATTTQVARRF